MKKIPVLLLVLTLHTSVFAQQFADTAFNPLISRPEYPHGKGPVVLIDEGHHNFHTKDGRYLPFARLLEKDGYVVKGYTGVFTKAELDKGKILVIANALNRINVQDWYLPTPSAFTGEEIGIVREWVTEGGNLFLIADHMPMAGAAAALGAAFGFEFSNGFAVDTLNQGPSYFSLADSTLTENNVTRGRDTSEAVHRVVTFTGQAFRIPPDATPVLIFSKDYISLMPDTAWVFDKSTRSIPVKGWSQGAFMTFGKGRVAVFGEAAMFTAQLAGPNKTRVGMNAPYARENCRLLLNIVHWLGSGQ